MTTWICKSALLAGALLGLSACDDIPLIGQAVGPTLGLLDGLVTGGSKDVVALSQTQMANGAFTLVPPDGFCLDRNTLRQDFALMARCDTLGVPRLAGGAPLGIVTVSVTPFDASESLPTPQSVAEAANLTRVDSEKSGNHALTFRAEGPAPGTGLDRVHWRGMAQVGDNLIGIAAYGPEGGRLVSLEGREVVNSVIRRVSTAS